jgi:Ku70/Ku80 N-terminal alpha/beta domain
MCETTDEEPKSALKTALECAYDLLLQRIIATPNDMMGILLFGTVPPRASPRPLTSVGKDQSRGQLRPLVQPHGP